MSVFDTCPHCGGHSIESNGLKLRDPDVTLLCVSRVKPDDASLDYTLVDEVELLVQQDSEGRVICGHQWNPHDEEDYTP